MRGRNLLSYLLAAVLGLSILAQPFAATFDPSGSGGGGGAPVDAQYWVGAANATLTAEHDLSGFTALVLNTAGTPSAYAGATSCTNQFFTGLSGTGASTCTTSTLAGAQHANQGTTTTVLHGNAAGNPSWAAVVSADLNITTTTCGAGDFINAISSTAVGTCATPAGGGASLDAITAAVADQAGIANADWNIRWNWAKTTNSEQAFRFSESAAATNGTSTGNVPNQVLVYIDTVAASTMSPLSVYSRGTNVFSVSPTGAQINANNGTESLPTYAFKARTDVGMYATGNSIGFATQGTSVIIALTVGGTGATSGFGVKTSAADEPTFGPFSGTTISTYGLFFPAANNVGISINRSENIRWLAGIEQASKGTADAVGYAINCRKSRNTVETPTVITTGDDTCGWYGIAYVGATNTYQTASYILQDTGGTISDSATGVGGLIDLYTAIVGAEPALRMRIDNVGHVNYSGTAPTISACGAAGTVAGNDMVMLATIANAAVTSCVINFAQTWATNAPVCTANDDTTALALTVAVSVTQVTVGGTFTNGDKIQILCTGRV